MSVDVDLVARPRDLAGPFPIPLGRGRWRVTLHSRVFVGGGYGQAGSSWQTTLVAVLAGARSRRLETYWNKPDAFTFTVDGRDPVARQLVELATDVYAWRWDDFAGVDVCMFHGALDFAEDEISEQAHVVVCGAHDYGAMLERRRTTGALPVNYAATTQDAIVEALVRDYGVNATSGATSFLPGSWLPLHVVMANPDGSRRTTAQQPRDRLYQPGSALSDLVVDLSAVINGFDYDVLPAPAAVGANYVGPTAGALPANVDALRIFYPVQGIVRTDIALVYGANVDTATRTVSSADYANRVFAVGNNGASDPTAAKLISDQFNADASGANVGLWVDVLNASDVSVQATLTEQARGQLTVEGTVTPTYTLGLRQGNYRYGYPNIGDVVPVIVQSGRLAVEDDQRVTGITYDVGDDGDETVGLTVGRPPATFGGFFRSTRRQLDALTRK